MDTHPTLGHVFYDPDAEAWLAFVRLPLVERWSPESEPPREGVDEILTRLHGLRRKLDAAGDTRPRTAQEDFDNWKEDWTESRADVLLRAWSSWTAKLVRAKRAEGQVCVRLTSAEGAPVRPIQERTVRRLIEDEATVISLVRDALAQSCREYGLKPSHAEAARVASISVHDDGLDDFAPVQFDIDCDWEVEHGMAVVYHPRTGANWTTADGVDDLVADACPPPAPPPPPTAEEELVAAIYSRDQGAIDRLQAQGVRPEPAYGSALFGAIHSRDVELVKRLLAAGADPNRADSHEGTPLQAARRALAEATLTLPGRTPLWMKAVIAIAKGFNAGALRRERRNAEHVVRLLLKAGAK